MENGQLHDNKPQILHWPHLPVYQDCPRVTRSNLPGVVQKPKIAVSESQPEDVSISVWIYWGSIFPNDDWRNAVSAQKLEYKDGKPRHHGGGKHIWGIISRVRRREWQFRSWRWCFRPGWWLAGTNEEKRCKSQEKWAVNEMGRHTLNWQTDWKHLCCDQDRRRGSGWQTLLIKMQGTDCHRLRTTHSSIDHQTHLSSFWDCLSILLQNQWISWYLPVQTATRQHRQRYWEFHMEDDEPNWPWHVVRVL